MKRLLGLLLFLPALALAEGPTYIQYGVAHTFTKCFYDYATGIDLEPTITFEDGDIKLSKDGTEDAAAGNDFTINDNGDCFDITMSAAQASAAYISIIFHDDDDLWLDTAEDFLTFGCGADSSDPRGVMHCGTAQAGAAGSITLAAAETAADDEVINKQICVIAGTGSTPIQCRLITDSNTTTEVASVNRNWITNPDSTSFYVIRDEEQAFISNTSGIVDVDLDSVEGTDATDFFDTLSEQHALIDATILNCEVNVSNFPGSTTTLACILTDRDAGAVTQASNDLEGKALLITSGADIRESRFINDTTWDSGNSELQLTLSRALPSVQADAVTALIL